VVALNQLSRIRSAWRGIEPDLASRRFVSQGLSGQPCGAGC
jgi:hypothetical protein